MPEKPFLCPLGWSIINELVIKKLTGYNRRWNREKRRINIITSRSDSGCRLSPSQPLIISLFNDEGHDRTRFLMDTSIAYGRELRHMAPPRSVTAVFPQDRINIHTITRAKTFLLLVSGRYELTNNLLVRFCDETFKDQNGHCQRVSIDYHVFLIPAWTYHTILEYWDIPFLMYPR